MLSPSQIKWIKFFAAGVILVYIILWILSFSDIKEWAYVCNEAEMAKGVIFIFLIFTVWTVYVIITLKSENMVGVNKDAIKNIASTSKSLALDMKKHEYDPEAMKEGQRKMFIVL